MAEPLLIVINLKNKTIRLESGNHRINTAVADGYSHLPATIQSINDNWLNLRNGSHFFDGAELIDWNIIAKCPCPVGYNPELILKP